MSKKVLISLVSAIILTMSSTSWAQCPIPDFDEVIPFCTEDNEYGITYPADTTSDHVDFFDDHYAGCLGSTPSPAWFAMQIEEEGPLFIEMSHSGQEDIDFACFGPFEGTSKLDMLKQVCSDPDFYFNTEPVDMWGDWDYYDDEEEEEEEEEVECVYSPEFAAINDSLTKYRHIADSLYNRTLELDYEYSYGDLTWEDYQTQTDECYALIDTCENRIAPYRGLDPRYYDITSNCFRSKVDQFPNGYMIDCSYSANAREICHIEEAKKGEWYLLLITNYSQMEGDINFKKAGGTATTNCSVIIDASVNDVCEGGDINLTVNNAPDGATFTWTGPDGFFSRDKNPVISNATKTNEGTYSVQMEVNGLTSPIVYLDVAVNPNFKRDTTIFIEYGESVRFGDDILTNEGLYSKTFTSKEGCDSIVNLNLKVGELKVEMSSNGPICEGHALELYVKGGPSNATFSWIIPNGGETTSGNVSINPAVQEMSGQYKLVMYHNGNTEVIGSINVEVNPSIQVEKDTIIAENTSFTFGEQVITEAGTYTQTFHSENDCDTIVTLNVSVIPSGYETNSPLCEGQTLHVKIKGVYPENTMYWSGPNNFRQQGGTEFTIDNVTKDNAGIYRLLVDVPELSETIDLLSIPVEVYREIKVDTTVSIMAGESYTFGSKQLTEPGTYTETYPSTQGCDSIVQLTLIVEEPTVSITSNGPICEGQTLTISVTSNYYTENSLHWFGPNNFTQDGGFELTISNAKASDAGKYTVKTDMYPGSSSLEEIASIPVEIYRMKNTDTTVTIQYGESYTFGSRQLTTPGTYTETYPSAQGCDSTVQLTLIVEDPNISISDNGPLCEGETLTITVSSDHYTENDIHWFGPNNFTQDGGFELTIKDVTTNDAGDYIVKTNDPQSTTGGLREVTRAHVNIYGKSKTDTSVTILTGQSYTFGSKQLTTAGTYTESLTNKQGCDSTVQLTLIVEDPDITIKDNGPICEDETITITVTSSNIPSNSLHWFGPNNFTQDGGYELTISNAKASDAGEYIVKTDLITGSTGEMQEIASTHIDVYKKSLSDTTVTIISGGYYTFGSKQLTTAGTYTEKYASAQGCDSIIQLTLIVEEPNITISNNGPLCEGGSLTITVSNYFPENTLHWFGPNNFTQDGGYELTINDVKASNAGDYFVKSDAVQWATGEQMKEIARTHVEIYGESRVNTTATIYSGESYAFGSNLLTEAGTYTDTLASSHGCDSIVRLTLRVEEVNITISNNGPLCEGETLVLSAENVPDRIQVQWTGPNNFSSDEPTVEIGNVSPRDSGTYQLEAFIGDIKLNTSSTHVDIYAANKVELIDSLIGESYTFGDMVIEKPGIYTLSFQNEHGCDSTVKLQLIWVMDTFQITPDPFFSPNGDGVKDYWFIENIEKYPSIVKIFDRYGKLIKIYDPYENESGWDGKDSNGNDLPSSDYWYIIINRYQDKVYTGHVTLLR